MSMHIRILPVAAVICLIQSGVFAQAHSHLWGEHGEQWSPESRLPDFSFAGYRRGETGLPSLEVTHNVRDYGAVGDGVHDDSDAFLKAIAEVREGVISIPKGRYLISKMLVINKPNLVLRGAGPDKTVLYFPRPLNDIKPNWGATTSGERTSNYSWSGGFITIRGSFRSDTLGTVTEHAERGSKAITVADASALAVGQEIEIRQMDDEQNSLANHLYSGDPRISMDKLLGRVRASLVTRITAITGNVVQIDRPLRFDVDVKWKPTVYRFDPTVTESGIESLGFEFPNQPYGGHFSELGNNAFAIAGAAHCWVRNVHVHNPDSGGFISGTFNTVDGIVYTSDRKPDPNRDSQGHHGITNGGNDNLFTNFDFQMKFIHDLTVSRSAGNVHSNGRGIDLALDHHRHANYENLFTNIDTGLGTRVWRSGGGSALGAHCGTRGTFWNIWADGDIKPPNGQFGPWSMNFVGVRMNVEEQTEPDARWYEYTSTAEVAPQNIHEEQLTRRRQRTRE
jgi:hypothetical protein